MGNKNRVNSTDAFVTYEEDSMYIYHIKFLNTLL